MNLINNWTRQIIISIIISTILLMLVPQNKNKKYIRIVVGVYLLAVILIPITNKIKKYENIKDIIDVNKVINNKDSKYSLKLAEEKNKECLNNAYEKYTKKNINDIYINSLEEDIKNKIEKENNNDDFFVTRAKVSLDNKSNNISKVYIYVKKNNQNNKNENNQNIINVKKISIDKRNYNNDDENKNEYIELSKDYEEKIKGLINNEYKINKDDIIVKGEKNSE